MKNIKRIALGVLTLGLAGVALAGNVEVAGQKFDVTGDVHGASAFQYRGAEFSAGEPSIGLKARAVHDSGVFAGIGTDTVKLPGADGQLGVDKGQLFSTFSVGYQHDLPYGAKGHVELKRNQFSGGSGVSDVSFTEVAAGVKLGGASLVLNRVVEGANKVAPGFSSGDTYGELGYTYTYNQKCSLGADVGYYWYGDKHVEAKDGLALFQVRAGYQVNDHLGVQLTHQFGDGEDALGDKASGNHKTYLKATYAF